MKKRIIKFTAIYFSVFFLLVALGAIFIKVGLPQVGEPPQLKVEATPERLERGKYLANNVMLCLGCHSERDWTKFSGPPLPGTLGKGGERFGPEKGFPGTYYAKNITPYALGDWTDGEIFRAITAGVDRQGRALFPLMPHPDYGRLDQEDIFSIIAYIRTLEPIAYKVPASESDFPMNFIINTIPSKPEFGKRPSPANEVAFGKYLVQAASCNGCHNNPDKGAFAGGNEFKMPDGTILRSSNLTPDKETGLGNWTRKAFISRFKTYADPALMNRSIFKGEYNSYMPWSMFAGMSEEDLGAIYAYLQTLEPVKNKVEKYSQKQQTVANH